MACKIIIFKNIDIFWIIGRKKLNMFQFYNLFAKFQPREKIFMVELQTSENRGL